MLAVIRFQVYLLSFAGRERIVVNVELTFRTAVNVAGQRLSSRLPTQVLTMFRDISVEVDLYTTFAARPRHTTRTYRGRTQEFKTTSIFKNDEYWGQPDGLCRKEKWPGRHMRAEALWAILNWDQLTTVDNC
jgi:hypothetical protein